MGKIRTILHVITLGIVDSNAEYERKNTPFRFTDTFTEDIFRDLSIKTAKPIKRLTVSTESQFVIGEVISNSGINKWIFILDFNDYGTITGRYWFRDRGNSDSQIPNSYAEQLKTAICSYKANASKS